MQPVILDENVLFESEKFKLHSIVLKYSNQHTFNKAYLKHRGSSSIVTYVDKNTIIMVKQWRYAIGNYTLEIPSGTHEKFETSIQCAKRELREETGYDSKNIEFISETFAAPGYSSEVCSVFTAKELFLSPLKPDLDEHIEIINIKIKNIPDLIKQGKILDQMSITSLLMASKFLGK